MTLIFFDLIEDATYFNRTNFLCVRYLLHHDHTIKKSKNNVYLAFHQYI
jgi:hypothetical protein